jgi:hypothetical protein
MICRLVSHLNRFKGISQNIQEYDTGVFRHPTSPASIFYLITIRAISTGLKIKTVNPLKGTPARIPTIIMAGCTANLFLIITGRL